MTGLKGSEASQLKKALRAMRDRITELEGERDHLKRQLNKEIDDFHDAYVKIEIERNKYKAACEAMAHVILKYGRDAYNRPDTWRYMPKRGDIVPILREHGIEEG